ncbi:MAG: signal peptide peptidase SppA [Myxococcota bacterium]
MRALWALCFIAILPATSALGQVRPGRIGAVPRPMLAPGAPAVDLNPAALVQLQGWALDYAHVDAHRSKRVQERGDAIWFGTRLPFGLALGAAAHHVRPDVGQDAGSLAVSIAYGRESLASGATIAGGATLRFVGSPDAARSRVTLLDASVAYYPVPWFAAALIGRDLNGALDVTRLEERIPGSFGAATAVRPFGTSRLTLETYSAVDTEGRLGMQTTAELQLGRLWRVQASWQGAQLFEQGDSHRFMIGARIEGGHVAAGGGAVVERNGGTEPGWYAMAGLRSIAQASPRAPKVALTVEIPSLGPRSLLRTLRYLEQIEGDPRVAALILRFAASGLGSAYAQELRSAVRQIVRAGKPVYCYLDAASGAEYYACAAGSGTYLDPAGGIRLVGLSSARVLLGEVLRSAGVRADFVRIGAFKSAPEQLTRTRSSVPAVQQRRAYFDDTYGQWLRDLSQDLQRSVPAASDLIDRGPYVSHEALASGLVSDLLDWYDLDRALEAEFGEALQVRARLPARPRHRWASGRRIGVVVVDGSIVDGFNRDVPIVEIHSSGGRSVVGALEAMAADPSIGAIVLRVDSSGGSALASDQIWRAVRRARARKPVVASMGAVAASGGYYVASAADEIWANPATLTGSIGVFFGKLDVRELLTKLEVGVELLERGMRAGLESTYRGFTSDERTLLAEKIRIWYRLFLHRIVEGRGMEIDDVDAIARGRIWSGEAAQRLGLVDRLGGFSQAIDRARVLAQVSVEAPVVIAPRRPLGWTDYLRAELAPGSRAHATLDSETYARSNRPRPHRSILTTATGLGAAPGKALRLALEAMLTIGGTRAGIPLAWTDAAAVLP